MGRLLQWNDVIEIGEKESDEKLDQVIGTLAPNECCSLLYTVSGVWSVGAETWVAVEENFTPFTFYFSKSGK